MNSRIIFSCILVSCALTSFAEDSRFSFESIKYEEYLYSKSKKTEVGDNVELDIDGLYKIAEQSSLSFGFQTYPEDNRFNNKTSKFELVAAHAFDDFKFSLDGELQTDEDDDGGTSLGVDLDSDKTFISYKTSNSSLLTFFPFNFGGEVGNEFNTWDVTRINYIEGTPSSVTGTPGDDEKIANKTIPGLQLDVTLSESMKFYYAVGKATYIYPANSSFNLVTSPTVSRWERKEVTGHKLGLSFKRADKLSIDLKFVTHNNTLQTGALIESASSLEGRFHLSSKLFLESEITYSKAGKAPWNINRASSWFTEEAPFEPVYADSTGEILDFAGETDFAVALKLVLKQDKNSPYVFYRHQGEHFIFRDRESAHLLRTADDSKSHGGLSRLGIGALLVRGNFLITPEFEYLKAKNPVFSSSSDVRDDRLLSDFKKTDYLINLKISYQFDGLNPFKI